MPVGRLVGDRMSFSKEDIAAMAVEFEARLKEAQNLLEAYAVHSFADARAQEYAQHGFARRLGTMIRCVRKVFDVLPPENTKVPDRDTRADAEIHIQAFLFNAVGAIDNLAWVCVSEKQIRKHSGKELSRRQVILQNSLVSKELSDGLRKTIDGLADWFEYLEDYRHALAHRIPLYVMPAGLEDSKAAEFQKLDAQRVDAINAGDFAKARKLKEQQLNLTVFRPLMMHSFGEKAKRMLFHPQLLSDLKQISVLGRAVLDEFPKGQKPKFTKV